MNLFDIKKAQVRAARGDRAAQQDLIRMTDSVTKLVNQRLRDLERHGYTYYAYNNPIHFTETMYEGRRFQTSKNIDYDWVMMSTQTQIGWKFLQMESSTVQGMHDIEQRRYENFVEQGLIDPDEMSRRRFRNFLKWVGTNDDVNTMVEAWSTSETMIEMMIDAYNRKGNTKKKMALAYNKFLSGKAGFTETMRGLGINPTNYTSRHKY